MNGGIRKRHIFNLSGVIVITLWIVMMSLLVKKQYFSHGVQPDSGNTVKTEEKGRNWKEIFLKDKKVGYSVNAIQPFENGYYIIDEIFLKLNLMGFEKDLHTVTQSSVDSDFKLKNFYFEMNSGAINYTISGKVKGNSLEIKTGAGRSAKTTELKLPEIPVISSGIDRLFKKIDLITGSRHRLSFFDPSSLTQKEAVFTVGAREKIKINNMDYDTYRIQSEMWGNQLTFWVDMYGDILREEGFMGLTMVKSSAANASLNLEVSDEDDFYEITAVEIDKKLPKADRLALLKLRLKGINESDFEWSGLKSDRQDFSNNILTVTRETEPIKVGYNVPFPGNDIEFKKYLSPEFNIESDDEEIIKKAQEITGRTKNPLVVSKKILEWVYRNIEKRPVVNIPSAVEVLHSKAGDCNEHATLLTALLRAAGIPARISVGLVYTRERFFYHAWVEAYTGEWVTMDPTLNQIPADVTHLSLLRGNIDKQVEIMGLIGKLRLEVIDFEYY